MSSPKVVTLSPAQRIKSPRQLTNEKQALILRLHQQGQTQQQIAQLLDCDQSTVSRTLSAFDDTRAFAKLRLHNAALPIAEAAIAGSIRAANNGKVQHALEILDRLDVLPRRRTESGGTSVSIVIGMSGRAAAPDPFEDRDVINAVATTWAL